MTAKEKEIEILLVEDSPEDAELTLEALRSGNLANHVEVVADGEEALDFLFARGRYQGRGVGNGLKVVLLDLKLPKVDGMEVLRQVKADPRTRHIPIVVLTSSREERDLLQSYRLGTNSFIQKPVEFGEFREVARQLGFYWLLVNLVPAGKAEA